MRQRSKPSTAQCNSALYTLFLLAEPKYVSCVRLSEILAAVSHDSINRFLIREQYTPKDLFEEVKNNVGSLKSSTSRMIKREFSQQYEKYYWGKTAFWFNSYYVSSAGGAPIETLKRYIQQQDRPQE